MTYATAQDTLSRYPQTRMAELTDAGGQDVDVSRVDVALSDASAEMDTYIGRRYSLPLASPPPALNRLACDIAIYRLMSLLPKEHVEDARRRYEDALKWLQDLAEGLVHLDGTDELGGNGSVRSSSNPRVFDSQGLKGFL